MVMDRIRRIIVCSAEPCNEPYSYDHLLTDTEQQRQWLQPINSLYNHGNSKYSAHINRSHEQRSDL